ncbi:MAG TPA: nuclease A inhibitor family protein [Gemmatimonadaceae bacterium]|nr:nuclease A inhibitor family protein [Gemmatimonadaceae bacterium]
MTDALRDRLELAAEGLLFSTESDRPFEFIRLGAREAVESLTPARVAEMVGRPDDRAAEWPLSRFLARHIERADVHDARAQALVPRYEDLESALRTALGTIRVFRIGAVEIQVLAIGNDPATGELAGLATVAVET